MMIFKTANIACAPRHLVRTLSHFARDDSGATAIEYAMIAAGVGATIASTVFTVGDTVRTFLYEEVVEGFAG